jgi:hypothetical protein
MLRKTRTLQDGRAERHACLLGREMQETRSFLEGNLDKEIVRNFIIYNVKYSNRESPHSPTRSITQQTMKYGEVKVYT